MGDYVVVADCFLGLEVLVDCTGVSHAFVGVVNLLLRLSVHLFEFGLLPAFFEEAGEVLNFINHDDNGGLLVALSQQYIDMYHEGQ
jgi:hypothetical protein